MNAKLWGLFGEAFLDLSEWIDTGCFGALDREITRGLAQVETRGTGATL